MKISGLFSDGMILQRGKINSIYGYTTPGEIVTVIIHKEGESLYREDLGPEFPADDMYGCGVEANEDGYFEISLPAYDEEGPYEIIIWDKNEKIYINDILMGDVFLLGGQSNMELTIGMIPDENEKVLSTAHNEKIRMFNVPHEFDFSGVPRVLERQPWNSVNKDTVADFSAIGYFFAKEKFAKDGVPVGLIHTAVGGAPIEALMSEENILKQAEIIRKQIECNGNCNHGKMDGGSPVVSMTNDCSGATFVYNLEHDKHRGCIYCYEELLKRNSEPGYAENVVKEDLARVAAWHEDVDKRDKGLINEWYLKDFDDADSFDDASKETIKLEMPAFFKDTKYEDWFGTLWLQKEFYVSEKHAGKEAKLYLGTLVDFDDAYVNGVKVGHTDYRYPQRRYAIPAGVIKPGRNLVTVRLGMDGNLGGFLPDMPYKVTIESEICKSRSGCTGGTCSTCGNDSCNGDSCTAGNTTETVEIKLTGMWNIKEGAKAERLDGETFFIWHPSGLFNSMIAPLKGLSTSAILFYQGESNSFAPEYYDILFKAMVDEWRSLVGDVPVYYSEVAVYLGDGPDYNEDAFAGVRESQRNGCRETENATLIEITKLPAPYNELHPQNKADVAHMFYEKFCEGEE